MAISRGAFALTVLMALAAGALGQAASGELPGAAQGTAPDLVIYSYDSFVAKHGLGPALLPLFEKSCGCRVKAVASGDGGQLLTRLQLEAERGKPQAQVVVGIDQPIFARGRALFEPFGKWKVRGFDALLPETRVGDGFIPFDYGVYALMADMDELKARKLVAPASLAELLKPEYRRALVLEDPRTSMPGLALLLYTQSLYKEGAWDFWKNLRAQWLTLAPGWDAAYGLFLKKEAPLVWSYVTSQAYHEEHGDTAHRYRAVLFKEGQPAQVEGAAVIKGGVTTPRQRELAHAFLEFLISADAQALVPKANWMLPARAGTAVPESFKSLPKPAKLVAISDAEGEINAALKKWAQVVQGASP